MRCVDLGRIPNAPCVDWPWVSAVCCVWREYAEVLICVRAYHDETKTKTKKDEDVDAMLSP